MTTETTAAPEHVLINGIRYLVLGEVENPPNVAGVTGRKTLLMVGRPKGVKRYIAERLPDSPIYGGNRGRILSPA